MAVVCIAAEVDGRPTPTHKSHYFGQFGPALASDYEGSDRYKLYPLPIVGWIRDGAYVRLEGDTIMTNILPMSLFELGPAARWIRKRSDVADDRIARMRNVSGTLEAGALFGALIRDPDEPLRQAGVRATVLQDISGSHDGFEVKLNALGGIPLDDQWSLIMNVSSRYASDDYMDTYFSVDANNAGRSGLSPYRAESGFKDVGVDASLSWFFSDHWGVGFIAAYTRLIGDAADSPIVRTAGSRDQFTGAITLNAQF
jgi:outer membrane scaffolding protein for murein synthesis (MipA/OmpV family)